MPLKSPRTLTGEELQTHKAGLRLRIAELRRTKGGKLRPDDLREHLEPLLLHCLMTKSIPQTAIWLAAEFGLPWERSAVGSTVKRWQIVNPGKTRASHRGKRTSNWGFSGAAGMR
jgi:hypothetical protein